MNKKLIALALAGAFAAPSLMANCIATTAGIPRVTNPLAIPANASVGERPALWHEFSTTSRISRTGASAGTSRHRTSS